MLAQRRPDEQVYVGPTSVSNVGATESKTEKLRWPNVVMLSGYLLISRLGKRELICLLLFTCNYVASVWRGFLFLWVLGMGYVILLWHSLSLHIIILVLRAGFAF